MEQSESPVLCTEADKAGSHADRRAMRLIFLIGPLTGLLICLAELQALISTYLWLGHEIVLPRFKLHLTLRFYWHLAGCMLLGIAIVWLALLAARRLCRELKTWPLLLAPLCASFVIFAVVFAAPGQWGVVPAAPLWVWPLVTIGAVFAILLAARPAPQPLPRLWPGLWRIYRDQGRWQALISILSVALATWASYYMPERKVLCLSIGFVSLNLVALLAAAVRSLRKRQIRRGFVTCLVLLLSVALIGVGSGKVLTSAVYYSIKYWHRAETMIHMARDYGGLADLPPSARNVDAVALGGTLSPTIILRFQADPADLDRWIDRSPGLTPAAEIPLWMHESRIWTGNEFGGSPRFFNAHGDSVGGQVVINDQTHTVFILVN